MKREPKSNPVSEIEAAIKLQQENVSNRKVLLNKQLIASAEVAMSGEFIREKLKDVLTPTNLLSQISGAVSGLVAGVLIKRVIIGPKASAIQKVIGIASQMAASKVVGKIVSALIKNKEKRSDNNKD